MSIKRLVAFGSVALVVLVTMVSAAAADTYSTGFENFSTAWTGVGLDENPGTVNGQYGWHSAKPSSIPSLPYGYDQQIVNNDTYGGQTGGDDFGDQSLRVSNAYTNDPPSEFKFQTYSKSTTENAGEGLTNTVYTGEFQFIPTSANPQPGLFVSVSPDNGEGGRMSYVSLEDTAGGIKMTFYDTSGDTTDPVTQGFVGYDLGTYPRDVVHTIIFSIKFVDGPSNDVVRLFVDGTDMGDALDACFTTWEQFYRDVSNETVPVTNSMEFRTAGNGNDIPSLVGHGYLFDNVTNTTAASGGPEPTTCGLADDGVIAPTGTTCSQYRDGVAPELGGLLYTTKGSNINAVSPGVFFYYTKVSGGADDTVGITEDFDGGTAIPIAQTQVVLYDALTCKVVKGWTPTVNDNGTATGDLPYEGDFIIGVKYNPSALKGAPAPQVPPITYSFGTTLEGAPVQVESEINLDLKH